jgi:hypothetical protein
MNDNAETIAKVLRRTRGAEPSPSLVARRVRLLMDDEAAWPAWVRAVVFCQAGLVDTKKALTPIMDIPERLDLAWLLEETAPGAREADYWVARRFFVTLAAHIRARIPAPRKPTSTLPPCFFCPRSARRYVEMRDPECPEVPAHLHVCAQHAPGTSGWRRAKRLVLWAGGVQSLGRRYRLRRREARPPPGNAPAADEALGASSLADWEKHATATGRDDRATYAASRALVDADFFHEARESRAEGGRRARGGGRPSQVSAAKLRRIRALADSGLRQSEIATRAGLSQPHVSRLLKSFK